MATRVEGESAETALHPPSPRRDIGKHNWF